MTLTIYTARWWSSRSQCHHGGELLAESKAQVRRWVDKQTPLRYRESKSWGPKRERDSLVIKVVRRAGRLPHALS